MSISLGSIIRQAVLKLNQMKFKIGGPDGKTEFDDLDFDEDSFVGNIITFREYRNKLSFNKLGEKINSQKWTVYPQSTNAWYNVNRNDITLPAGGINEVYNPNADKAYNYGALGTRIAHEMTHGFDDTGRLYSENGKYESWWHKGEIAEFEVRKAQLIEYYDNFTVLDSLHVNGKSTFGENLADLGGVEIAYDAYLLAAGNSADEIINGYTGKQRFFLAYAQKWREVFEDETLAKSLNGWHAPPKYRTNGVVYNVDEFYEAFSIEAGGKMSKSHNERIKIW